MRPVKRGRQGLSARQRSRHRHQPLGEPLGGSEVRLLPTGPRLWQQTQRPWSAHRQGVGGEGVPCPGLDLARDGEGPGLPALRYGLSVADTPALRTEGPRMRYRRLGRSGLTVSVVGLGCNNLGGRLPAEGTQAVVDAALMPASPSSTRPTSMASRTAIPRASWPRHWDRDAARSCWPRSSAWTCPGPTGRISARRGSRRYVITAVEASLRRLGTEHIDLLQMHEPDPQTPIEETLSALDSLIRSGKVRYVGSSNFAAWQVVEAEYVARRDGLSRFISAQNRYSLLSREAEAELVPACERHGVGLIPYFPLESGLLTGKYHRGEDAPRAAAWRGSATRGSSAKHRGTSSSPWRPSRAAPVDRCSRSPSAGLPPGPPWRPSSWAR